MRADTNIKSAIKGITQDFLLPTLPITVFSIQSLIPSNEIHLSLVFVYVGPVFKSLLFILISVCSEYLYNVLLGQYITCTNTPLNLKWTVVQVIVRLIYKPCYTSLVSVHSNKSLWQVLIFLQIWSWQVLLIEHSFPSYIVDRFQAKQYLAPHKMFIICRLL